MGMLYVSFLVGLLAWGMPANAQTYTALQVQFSRLGTFTQAQLEGVAGMRAGTTLTATDLGAAAQRLVDTGYFDDVGATIEGKISAATIDIRNLYLRPRHPERDLSAEAFATTAKLHAGDVASRAALLETLPFLDAAYRRKGYMDVVVKATPTVDEADHGVAYTMNVVAGEPYRVHEVTAGGLDPAAKADFDRGWRMKPGELYNREYVAGFLKANTALRALAGYGAGFKAYADFAYAYGGPGDYVCEDGAKVAR